MNLDEAMVKLGMNKEETLYRFSGSSELLMHFIKRFPLDTTFSELLKAIQLNDWKKIEIATHTLKGVSGNLGFTELYRYCTALVEEVRLKKYEEAEKTKNEVISSYNKVITVIKQID